MCKKLKFVLQVYDISNAQNCPAKYINLSVFQNEDPEIGKLINLMSHTTRYH